MKRGEDQEEADNEVGTSHVLLCLNYESTVQFIFIQSIVWFIMPY